MKLSLMTLNLFFMIFYRFMILKDMEELRENYEEMLDMIRAAGYTQVDVLGMEVQILGVDYVKEQLDKRGLQVSSLMYGDQFAKQGEEHDAQIIAGGKQGVDNAVKLGTKVIMLIPQLREDMSGFTREQVQDAMVRRMAPVAAYAREQGLIPVIEDTPQLDLHLCSTEDLTEVMGLIPGMDMVYDSGNMLLVGEDPVTYFKTFQDQISHIHLKDMRVAKSLDRRPDRALDGTYYETAPSGRGVVDFDVLLSEIKSSGYEGNLTVEFAVEQGEDITESLRSARLFFEEKLGF